MSSIDWIVLVGIILFIVVYGIRKSRGATDIKVYLLSNREMRWFTIGLSIIATQASAITFLSAPGQAFDDGMRFIQFYFGLPIAMVILSLTVVPLYHKLKVFTAYEYLERRFDLKVRALAAFLFLIQRGLAAGFTIFAPSIILSGILGWNIYWTNLCIGLVVIIYTVAGGTRAVSYTQKQQMLIILSGILVVGIMLINLLPRDISLDDAMHIAGKMDKLNAVDFSFDWEKRYNIWSGIIGGLFLALSYFGTDQSQVQRYLGGRSVRESRLGLLMNGLVKLPMQFLILMIGVLLFVFYQFEKPPIFFDEVAKTAMYQSKYNKDFQLLEQDYNAIYDTKKQKIREMLQAIDEEDQQLTLSNQHEVKMLDKQANEIRQKAINLIKKNDPKVNTNDLDRVFITFVTQHLPTGLVGLLIAVIISASMSSTSSELNALASTTLIDVYKRIFKQEASKKHYLYATKILTFSWGIYAILFASYASRLGNLIQAVNILGSLFYGTILGIFLVAFYFKKIGGKEVLFSAIFAEIIVVACFLFTKISFLWYNVVGCLAVVLLALLLHPVFLQKKTA